jgi:biotin operon repressor
MTWFGNDGRPEAVDQTHPTDILEPESESPVRSAPDPIILIERIGGSFLRGDPFIIQVAWSFLLNRQTRSMQACAKELGCTRQAISRQVTQLAIQFGYPIRNKLRRQRQREAAKRSWVKRKRREDTRPPAANEDQLKTNTHAIQKGGRP